MTRASCCARDDKAVRYGVRRRVSMPVAKGYTKSQWEAFASALDALPEKPDAERSVLVREAMK